MNSLSTRQRKLVYTACAVLLLFPIIWLGQPASVAGRASGGKIAVERFNQDLGDASLGDVDPASTSMSLVLLGLRGMAANVLWMQADKEKETKQWSQLERTIERILLLQPHFQTVWKLQCWNLTYNVSAECDAVEDRFFWVKKGLVFLTRGVSRNATIPELPHDLGDFCGKKIGRADERDFFRKFFVVDPDRQRFNGGPDIAINPNGVDNYFRARDWYEIANTTADLGKVQQHKMDFPLFFAYPFRSLMDYATARQQDANRGLPPELAAPYQNDPARLEATYQDWLSELFQDAKRRWGEAYTDWTSIYGRRTFETPIYGKLQIDGTDEELARLAADDGMTLDQKRQYRDRYQNTTGYRFWKLRCEVEAENEMADAHKLLIVGRKLYREDQDMEGAEARLREGLTQMQKVFEKYREPSGRNQLALDDSDLAEECLKAIIIYRQVRDVLGTPLNDADDFPCKLVWTEPDLEGLRAQLIERFQRWQGSGG